MIGDSWEMDEWSLNALSHMKLVHEFNHSVHVVLVTAHSATY